MPASLAFVAAPSARTHTVAKKTSAVHRSSVAAAAASGGPPVRTPAGHAAGSSWESLSLLAFKTQAALGGGFDPDGCTTPKPVPTSDGYFKEYLSLMLHLGFAMVSLPALQAKVDRQAAVLGAQKATLQAMTAALQAKEEVLLIKEAGLLAKQAAQQMDKAARQAQQGALKAGSREPPSLLAKAQAYLGAWWKSSALCLLLRLVIAWGKVAVIEAELEKAEAYDAVMWAEVAVMQAQQEAVEAALEAVEA